MALHLAKPAGSWLLAASCALLSTAGHAQPAPAAQSGGATLTLAQAYQAALGHDAQYRAASHEADSTREGVPLARASLLPQVNLTASNATVQGWRQTPNNLNQEQRLRLDYQSPQAALQLRVPVFNWQALQGYKISQAQAEVADLIYNAQSLELLDRVAEAYFRMLMAEESRNAFEGQITSFELQVGQAEQRLQRGEGTRVQVAQMKAALDLARARKLEADDQVDLAARQLQRTTGLRDVSLQQLSTSQVAAQPPTERLGDWLELGVRQSAALQARMRSVDVAKLAVRRESAGHLPRLDLVASLSRSENDSVANLGQTTSQRSLSLQLNVPLYSGGAIDAGVRQATARQAKADEELRDERERLELDIQRFFQAATNGARTVAAYRQAKASAELAWQGTRRALELGLGTAGDAAQSQAAYLAAERDLAQALNDQMMARIRLMARAGVPAGEIASEVDSLLAPKKVPPTPR